MKRSALPLVRGVYGRVRICFKPSSVQAFRNALETEPLSFRHPAHKLLSTNHRQSGISMDVHSVPLWPIGTD